MYDSIPEEFRGLVERAKGIGRPLRVALAGADVENMLQGLFEAAEDGFVEPILIGNYKKVSAMLEKLGLTDRRYDFQPVSNDVNPVQYAIEMVRAGSADALMRGSTQTRDFLLPVLNKANHLLKEDRLITHVNMFKIPGYSKILAISDVTLLIEPSIEQREKVVKNIVEALGILGIKKPNIALLALVEKPAFHIRDTVEAQTIVLHHREEPIADCNLVGPITYDLIMSKKAAELKNFDCPYCGEFDGIVVPNLLSGNIICKVLDVHAGVTGCCMLVGAKVPIAITGRSESKEQAYLSLAAIAVQSMSQ